jgi:hypothetical protein
MIQHHNTIYLDELQHELWEKHHVYTTVSTLSHALQCLQITFEVDALSLVNAFFLRRE